MKREIFGRILSDFNDDWGNLKGLILGEYYFNFI